MYLAVCTPKMDQAMPRALSVKAPGRICFFGDHQDYLGLPVIVATIDDIFIWKLHQRWKRPSLLSYLI